MEQDYEKVTADILKEIKEIVGEKNVIFEDKEKLEEYGTDAIGALLGKGHMPEVAVKPDSTEQVSKIMRMANEKRVPVTPRGAGTGLSGAAIPTYGGIVLSLERMNRILEVDTVDRIAVVESGVITNDLCQKAAEHGLMYAGYPMSTQSSFIGGNVATNAGGGKVIKYGNTRRHVLGLEVVLPNGEVLTLGGRLRKSTWGYSLLHLMIGSEGTLGIITKITVNLIPGGGKSIDLLVPFADTETAVDVVSKIIVTGGILPEAVEYIDRLTFTESAKYQEIAVPFQDNEDVEAYLIIQLHGESQEDLENSYEKAGEICLENGALDVFVAENRRDSENIWKVREEIGEGMRQADPNYYFSGDIVVPFSKVPEMIKEIKRLEEKHKTKIPTAAHIADGNFHSALFKPESVSVEEWPDMAEGIYDEMADTAIRLGGAGSGEHGVGIMKKQLFLRTKSESELNILRGIKKTFDPNYILNPGKIM